MAESNMGLGCQVASLVHQFGLCGMPKDMATPSTAHPPYHILLPTYSLLPSYFLLLLIINQIHLFVKYHFHILLQFCTYKDKQLITFNIENNEKGDDIIS